ncbi:hypothetical protein ACQP2P_15950 [Dactylosporangium sp. CA-139114]|uniref:hypothetical protein n=1 Tax=Dactylosporangium sp. CA-139114 TaxID=3239931 RepID=UPI003D9898EF
MPVPTDTAYRVRRPLTAAELESIRGRIDAATDTTTLLVAAVIGVFDALLADLGQTYPGTGTTPQQRIDPRQYAIPQTQWTAIADAVTNRAHAWGGGITIGLDLVNLMPSAYDDPTVPAPWLSDQDHRPQVYRLEVSREAADEIAACETHLQHLAAFYGPSSDTYQQALSSWHRQLATLFATSLGATSLVHRDGPLSLHLSGLVFGVIFHGERRTCLAPGCHAEASGRTSADDPVVWRPRYDGATVLDHPHIPSYPLDAPQPGTWSLHS